MTTTAWVLLGCAGVAAVVDWVAVGRGLTTLEYGAKPTATIAFLAVALTLDPVHGDVRTWFVVALVACLAGDVFLMLPGGRFVFGLGSFLVAQVLFAVGFSLHAGTVAEHMLGVGIVAAFAVPLCRRFVRALRASGRSELVVPVVVYIGAIGAMAATAIASGNAVAIAGALLFMASDALIAETRFVRDHRGGRVAIMVTYHAALAGLVLSLL